MDDIKISELPYVGYTGYNPTDLFVNVNNGETKNTTLEDIKTYIVSGISVSAGTSVTGFTYTPSTNTFRVFNNNGTSYPATLTSVSGLTVNGDLNVTGNTSGGTFYGSGQGLNSIPLSGITDLTSLLDGKFDKSGGTINGNLTVTGNTNLQTFTAGTGTINGNLTVTGNTNLSGTTLYDENIILGNNPLEITNVRFLTGYVETYDVYVTGTTYTAATNNTDRTTWQFQYHSTPIGNPPYTFTGQNTFITGFTYDNANTFTLKDNSGNTFNSTINTVTGLTINGNLNISGNTSQTGNTTQLGNVTITGNTSLNGNLTLKNSNSGNTGTILFDTSLITTGTTETVTFQNKSGQVALLSDLASGEPNSKGYVFMQNNGTGNLNMAQNTWYKVSGTTSTIANYLNFFTTGSSSNQLLYTFPAATGGTVTYLKYAISITFNTVSGKEIDFQLRRNGVESSVPPTTSISSTGNNNATNLTGIVTASFNDSFELYVRTTSTGTPNVTVSDLTISLFT